MKFLDLPAEIILLIAEACGTLRNINALASTCHELHSCLLGYLYALDYKQVFSDDNTIFLINALSASFNILFTLTCTALVDRAGRRFMLYTGAGWHGPVVACRRHHRYEDPRQR